MPGHQQSPLLKLARINWIYVVLICMLAGVGYVALYSAGGGAPYPFAQPQALRFFLGLAIMLSTSLVPPAWLRRMAFPTYALSIALLLLVLKMGHVGKGAERWVNILGLQFQPSEFAKVALVLMLATWFSSPHLRWKDAKKPLRMIIAGIFIAIPFVLILKEPNLGTAVITGILGVSICFAAGLSWYVIGGGLLSAVVGAKFIYGHLHAYQKARITTFLHPEHDPLGAGYNIIQSKIALGSGGVWGRGYLHGTQGQLNFLPEKQTDFIFTMIGEEWGYLGTTCVLILLAALVFGGMYIATQPRLRFLKFLALGIAMDFFLYVAVNLSMVTGVIPVGGVPLPLVSYGGSALLTMMFGFGLLMSCWVHRFQDETN